MTPIAVYARVLRALLVALPVLPLAACMTAWKPYPPDQAAAAHPGKSPGDRFPDLVFADTGGREHAVSDYRGRVVVINFWASWCKPCAREMPHLEALHRRHGGDDRVVFLLLNSKEDFGEGQAWARERGLDLPLFDSRELSRSEIAVRGGGTFFVAGLPTSYVLDGNGLVVEAFEGEVYWPGYEDALEGLMDAVARSGGG